MAIVLKYQPIGAPILAAYATGVGQANERRRKEAMVWMDRQQQRQDRFMLEGNRQNEAWARLKAGQEFAAGERAKDLEARRDFALLGEELSEVSRIDAGVLAGDLEYSPEASKEIKMYEDYILRLRTDPEYKPIDESTAAEQQQAIEFAQQQIRNLKRHGYKRKTPTDAERAAGAAAEAKAAEEERKAEAKRREDVDKSHVDRAKAYESDMKEYNKTLKAETEKMATARSAKESPGAGVTIKDEDIAAAKEQLKKFGIVEPVAPAASPSSDLFGLPPRTTIPDLIRRPEEAGAAPAPAAAAGETPVTAGGTEYQPFMPPGAGATREMVDTTGTARKQSPAATPAAAAGKSVTPQQIASATEATTDVLDKPSDDGKVYKHVVRDKFGKPMTAYIRWNAKAKKWDVLGQEDIKEEPNPGMPPRGIWATNPY